MHFHERRKRVFFEGSGSLARLCTSKRDNRQCQSSIEEKQGHFDYLAYLIDRRFLYPYNL